MQPLRIADLQNIYEYEKNRDTLRKETIAYKRLRRVQLGPDIVLTFENRRTMRFQIQEMMRAERMVHDAQIQAELDIYNQLLPGDSDLSATLFIEITQEDQIREKLHHFLGLTDSDALVLQFGKDRVPAVFEAGREEADRISSVHYIRFPFNDSQREIFLEWQGPANLALDYGPYVAESSLGPEALRSLQEDLG